MKKWLIIIVVIGLAAAVYGYYLYNKPVKSLKNAKAEYALTAAELLGEYESNESAANEKFLDEVVEVSGVVEKVENENEKKSIYLKTGNMMSSVICELDDREENPKVSAGDEVTVKGLCSGYLMDVVLVRSVII